MLKGKNVYLRAPELEDGRIFSAWLNDRETNKYLDVIYPISKRYSDDFIMEYENDYTRKLFIIDNVDRKPIGFLTVDNIRWEYRNCEIGIVIYDKNSRGKGLGRDALETLIKFIFDSMNMHIVYLRVTEDNKKAISLYQELGFETEGVLRDRYYKNGKFINLISMSKIKEGEV